MKDLLNPAVPISRTTKKKENGKESQGRVSSMCTIKNLQKRKLVLLFHCIINKEVVGKKKEISPFLLSTVKKRTFDCFIFFSLIYPNNEGEIGFSSHLYVVAHFLCLVLSPSNI